MRHHANLLNADVLKASHHGAENGADGSVGGRFWIETVSPEGVVISAGRNNKYGHPHDAAMDVYETLGHGNVHCTHRHGTVRVYGYRNGSHRVRHQHPSERSCRQ